MEYIYAALLLHRAGKKVDEEGLKRVVEAAGISPDMSKIKSLAASLSEINIDEVLKQAAAAPVATAAPAAAPAASAPAPAEKPKEEKKEEEKEEALSGLSALFG
ncbi:MAG: 50S ribosomal protein P1 [Candidatus Caldarchaeum sp.]|nr:50S ribosomal protein P1 [Candidatus Caldarchaeum sp.]MCS7137976.1 50S ribosomal protein P1 [Candidatus Caldarchaeum sp.]MDW7978837.1 50S ribosomal protein P1 [Candidatus Caldarchaeum sp.]MDW8359652.1 50S ribosomal protein P1 [Candidatus Caldarchaeum sp.]